MNRQIPTKTKFAGLAAGWEHLTFTISINTYCNKSYIVRAFSKNRVFNWDSEARFVSD